MNKDNPIVHYEDIKDIPIQDLLGLPDEDLIALIRQAETIAGNAKNVACWLGGVRLEKALRDRFDDHGKGGEK